MGKFWVMMVMLLGSLRASTQTLDVDNQSIAYNDLIESYRALADKHNDARLYTMGQTDCGKPLHLFIIADTAKGKIELTPEFLRDKVVMLVNNGIHAGESCGIDASLQFCKRLLKSAIPSNVVYALIPVYNVGGMLNRGSFSRANQNGPHEHGFRGNARHLDLNRDFVKADALNTHSFYEIFHLLKPHIFVDTHTSNGANYQYTITLISSQKDKLNPVLADYMRQDIEPYLYQKMNGSGWEMVPYVNGVGATPNEGFTAFLETPRFSSGYAAQFNTMSFITETHMLKPFKDRVASTLTFLQAMSSFCETKRLEILKAKQQASALDAELLEYEINWSLDTTESRSIDFKGYEFSYEPSKIWDGDRLKYHDDKPTTFATKYWENYKATHRATTPQYYVLPQAWREVVARLRQNSVEMVQLEKDSLMLVNNYYLKNPVFSNGPYEGHFLIKDIQTEVAEGYRKFSKGDFLVPVNQTNKRFLISVLEPLAVDSYLRWNFFDEVFQQKEHFSPYVFEETAMHLLKENTELKKEFEDWKKAHPAKAKNAYTALNFIYKRSAYYEKEHLLYPVARVE